MGGVVVRAADEEVVIRAAVVVVTGRPRVILADVGLREI
jgi:hypothetical protein